MKQFSTIEPELIQLPFTEGQDGITFQTLTIDAVSADGVYSDTEATVPTIMNEGRKHASVYIGHEQRVTTDEEGNETTELYAMQIRVTKPLTRAKAINQAEMLAYRLTSALEVASFGTSIARKARENAEDEEVVEHDQFIAYVKEELTAIGIN